MTTWWNNHPKQGGGPFPSSQRGKMPVYPMSETSIGDGSLGSGWCTYPSEKWWTSSFGMMTFHSQCDGKVIKAQSCSKAPTRVYPNWNIVRITSVLCIKAMAAIARTCQDSMLQLKLQVTYLALADEFLLRISGCGSVGMFTQKMGDKIRDEPFGIIALDLYHSCVQYLEQRMIVQIIKKTLLLYIVFTVRV